MNLITWHGTILRVDPATSTWFHDVPWPNDDSLVDLDLDIPESGLKEPRLLGDVAAEPLRKAGCITLRQGVAFLCADPGRAHVAFDQPRANDRETFLPITPSALARLRNLLGSIAQVQESGDLVSLGMAEGFALRASPVEPAPDRHYKLAHITPAGERGLTLHADNKPITLHPIEPRAIPPRIALRMRQNHPPLAPDADTFAKGPAGIITIAEASELAYPPLTVSDADQVWMQRHPWWPGGQSWGRVEPRCQLVRARDVYVLMSRGLEGTIFDADGLFTDPGYLAGVPVTGRDHFSRTADTIFIDQAAMQAAPFVPGQHVVFYGGNMSNYFHWLIEALVPLHAMAAHLPPGTRLLLPGTLATLRAGPNGPLMPDHLALLDEWGFGDMPKTTVTAKLCRVEEVFWLADSNISNMPARVLQNATIHARASVPVHPDSPRRIYIRRSSTRRVHNAAETETFVAGLGFSIHDMRDLSSHQQIALFHQAEFVIGPHGADLSNLMFCPPGARVIELSPAAQFRPFFAQISDKMGLCHAVLPCRTGDGSFQGNMQVDIGRLSLLIDQLSARRT